ncbi:MAG: CDP-diacylglycerol--serine O-phosphatidyltransferase [Thiotrichales bacterium]
MTDPEKTSETAVPHRHRSIYLLPNLFTTAAMFAGFFAIIAAQSGRFNAAAIAIFIAMLLDTVDGRVARMTNTQTEFGAQYDSLADLISFGLAPALVIYEWSLIYVNDFGPGWAKPGWLAAFFYTAAAAMRLARFNTATQVENVDKKHFIGLPSPTAAALVIGMVWIFYDMGLSGELLQWPAFFLTVATGALMVSNFRYLTFKEIDFKSRVPFLGALLIVVALMLISFDPPKILFTGFLIYTLSAPLLALIRWRKR